MGRKSKLTDKQWSEIQSRLLGGEIPATLAREYGVDKAQITRRFSQPVAQIKTVANQLLEAEDALRALPLPQQIATVALLDTLRSIGGHLAGAANYGAATSHRLSGIAHAKAMEIDDAAPLNEQSLETLKSISALTRIANDAAATGLNLLNANKELAKQTSNEPIRNRSDFYADT